MSRTMTPCLSNPTSVLHKALACTLLLSLYACSSIDTQEQAEVGSPQELNSTPEPSTTYAAQAPMQSRSNNIDGKPLWIWIAPDYRGDLPEGNSEYVIDVVHN